MQIIVTRHAETNYNAEHLVNYDCRVDVYLTQNGLKQAEKLAEDLRHEKIDVVFVSRLNRTKQTAEIVNKFHSAEVIEDGRLDDIYNGFEGKTTYEARAWRNTQPDPVTAKLADEWESVKDVNVRVRDFLADTKEWSDKNILIVTSSHLVKHFKAISESRPITDVLVGAMPNAKFYKMEIEEVK